MQIHCFDLAFLYFLCDNVAKGLFMSDTNSKSASSKVAGCKALVNIQGKQHLVYPGAKIECEKVDYELGSELAFDQVLCVLDGAKTEFGAPYIKKTVTAKVIEHYRDRKVIIFKKLRRHGYQRKRGHRQNVSVLEIMSIA